MRLALRFGLFVLLMMLGSVNQLSATNDDFKSIVFVGTFRREPAKGIYAFRMDPRSGKMESLGLAVDAMRPIFLVVHPNRRFLYAASRPTTVDRTTVGEVIAYSIDPNTAKLTKLNSYPTRGIDPAYVAVDRTGRNLFVANFGSNDGSGNVALFPIKKDGSLAEASDFIEYSGTGVHPQRQKGPHSHAINVSPDNRFVFVTDLGLDKVFIYRFDAEKGKLSPANPAFVALPPGSGPRLFVFHPGGKFLYVVNELQSTLTTFAYSSGSLKVLQTVSTLPPEFKGTNSASTLQVHPNGKYLYASNRGADSIVVYSIGPDGTLTFVKSIPSNGKTPGNFVIDPSGNWLLVANQGSDALVIFRIDTKSGLLEATGQSYEVGTPSCVRFLQVN